MKTKALLLITLLLAVQSMIGGLIIIFITDILRDINYLDAPAMTFGPAFLIALLISLYRVLSLPGGN